MASSRDSSNGPDVMDVAQATINYQHFNGCRIEVVVTAEKGIKQPYLIVTARALRDTEENLGVTILASVSVASRSTQYRYLDAVILKALYDLDVAMWVVVEEEKETKSA